MDNAKRISELEAEIDAIRKRMAEEREALRQTVKPVYRFTLDLDTVRDEDTKQLHFRGIADPACWVYRLNGKVVNRDELLSVGVSPHEGGHSYVFNRATGRFVMATGGGSLFLHLTPYFSGKVDTEAFAELEAFLAEHPEGGDVTEIVEKYRSK